MTAAAIILAAVLLLSRLASRPRQPDSLSASFARLKSQWRASELDAALLSRLRGQVDWDEQERQQVAAALEAGRRYREGEPPAILIEVVPIGEERRRQA